MGVALLEASQDWYCPECGRSERTRPLPPNASRYHPCPQLHMLTAPLARAGTDCKLVAVERGDYLRGAEQRTGDDGRPYMAVQTVYGDGRNDVTAFAEVAIARFGGQRA